MSAVLSDPLKLTDAEERRMHLLKAQACRLEAMAHELNAAAYDIEGRVDGFWYQQADAERQFAAKARAAMRWNQECAANYAPATVSADEE